MGIEGRGVTSCCPAPAFLSGPMLAADTGKLVFACTDRQDVIEGGRSSREILLHSSDVAVHISSDLEITDVALAVRDDQSDHVSLPPPNDGCCRLHAATIAFVQRIGKYIMDSVVCDPVLTTRITIMVMLGMVITLMTVLTWYFTSTHAERSVSAVAAALRHELLARAEDCTKALLENNNASATALSRLLSSPLIPGDYSSFSTLEQQVRPILFSTFSVLAHRSVVSFYGRDGLFVSYTSEFNMTNVLYANVSYLSTKSSELSPSSAFGGVTGGPWYEWYRQAADVSTGLPVGSASHVSTYHYWESDTFNKSFNDRQGRSFWGVAVTRSKDLLLVSLSPVRKTIDADAVGVAIVGSSVSEIGKFLDTLDLEGGDMYLTTAEGRLLVQTKKPVNFEIGDLGAALLPLATSSNNSIVRGAATFLASKLGSNATQIFQAGNVKIYGSRYIINSSPIQIAQTTLVCVVIIPRDSVWGSTDKRSETILALLLLLAICVGMVGCFFIILLTKGVSNEMRLRAALIQQLEATKQAENKSSHKSIVFASMSHDLRTPLAAILGLIDLCLCDSLGSPELESNLIQMKSCATNLLGILNSILDMSKIEAGKLQLEESEFDLLEVLEEAVDIFAVVGLQKGLEVVLDLPDESIEKSARVWGDSGRVKQVLSNLLSNGVKFTSEGHVVLRAWQKPIVHGGAIPSEPQIDGVFGSVVNLFQKCFSEPEKNYEQMEGDSEVNGNLLEFEFEVDDTGKGIPRDRRKAVFENFVQVDSSVPRTHGGTGLGLGIVRSLVRLMGGDINIVDKDEPGEPGSCFRFNLFFRGYRDQDLSTRANGATSEQATEAFPTVNMAADYATTVSPLCCVNTAATEGAHVLLAMQGQAGKKVAKRWLEHHGLQVWTVSHWEDFSPTLEKIKFEIFYACGCKQSDEISPLETFDSWADDCQLSTCDFRKVNSSLGHLLLVIDTALIPESLERLSPSLQSSLIPSELLSLMRVVWLATPNTPSSTLQNLKQGSFPCDLVLHKPLHISRLHSLWEQVQLLCERRELERTDRTPSPLNSDEIVNDDDAHAIPQTLLSSVHSLQERDFQKDSSEMDGNYTPSSSSVSPIVDIGNHPDGERSAFNESGVTVQSANRSHHQVFPGPILVGSPSPEVVKSRARETEIMGPPNSLRGMHILVAEDNAVLQKLTKTTLVRLGATVECVDNGHEAVQAVLANLPKKLYCKTASFGSFRKLLSSSKEPFDDELAPRRRPFDMVLMDCQMPVLDGYAATQLLREQEKVLGYRTPVIALTAHAMAKDESKCIEAGMDFYLTKPLATKALLHVLTKLNSSRLEV